jgi:hypothetical protein
VKVALVALLLLPALPAASSLAWTMREDGPLIVAPNGTAEAVVACPLSGDELT